MDGAKKKTLALTRDLYRELFLKFHKPLCLFSGKIVDCKEDAEDVVHNVFLRFWESGLTYHDPEHIKAYLFRTVYHKSLNYKRHQRYLDQTLQKNEEEEKEEDNYLRYRIETEVFLEVMQALDQLPGRCREVFKLSYIDGLKVAEVAERLQISEDTVKTQRLKGRKLLQDLLKNLFPLWLILMCLDDLFA